MAWRKIRNNRIQTFYTEVYLWDAKERVAIRVAVPKNPWTKINADFTHWHNVKGIDPDMFPATVPHGTSPNPAHFIASGTILESDSGELFLRGKAGDIVKI